MHQVHPLVYGMGQANPISDASDAHFGQDYFHHSVDHRGNIANLQRLFDECVWYKLVRDLDERQHLLTFWRENEGVVHERS